MADADALGHPGAQPGCGVGAEGPQWVERSLVIGVGASRGVPAAEVIGLIEEVLGDAGLGSPAVCELATVRARAAEPGLLAAARWFGVPLVAHPADQLARIAVPHPSTAALGAVGTPSVAEAAAVAGGGELLVPKRKSRPAGRAAMATCAVARRVPIMGDPAAKPAAPTDKTSLDREGWPPPGRPHGQTGTKPA